MEAKEWLRLEEVEALHGVPASSLRRKLAAGDKSLVGRQVPLKEGGKRLVWEIHHSCLSPVKDIPGTDEYESLYAEFVDGMETGFNNGKRLAADTVANFKYGMRSYWRNLGVKPSLEALTPENARLAMSNLVRAKEEERARLKAAGKPVKDSCNFGSRQAIYRAFQSFYSFLVERSLKPVEGLLLLKQYRPKRSTPIRRTFLYLDQMQEALKVNSSWIDGRGEFGVVLTETIFLLGALGGLRSKEIRTLTFEDFSLADGVMKVTAKGKTRDVGMDPDLVKQIKKWLHYRPKSNSPLLMLQKNGAPLTKRVIARRIQGLANRMGVDLTPHGCRRTAGGYWETVKGLTWSEMGEMFGHGDIEVTKGYVPRDRRSAIDKLRGKPTEQSSTPMLTLPKLRY